MQQELTQLHKYNLKRQSPLFLLNDLKIKVIITEVMTFKNQKLSIAAEFLII